MLYMHFSKFKSTVVSNNPCNCARCVDDNGIQPLPITSNPSVSVLCSMQLPVDRSNSDVLTETDQWEKAKTVIANLQPGDSAQCQDNETEVRDAHHHSTNSRVDNVTAFLHQLTIAPLALVASRSLEVPRGQVPGCRFTSPRLASRSPRLAATLTPPPPPLKTHEAVHSQYHQPA